MRRHVERPRHYVKRHVRFTPWSQPTVEQAKAIARAEAKLWHVSASHLLGRMWCESRWIWWKSNGGKYRGLLQFHIDTFRRGLGTIGSGRVRLVRSRIVRQRTRVTLVWSDGRRATRKGRAVAVRRTTVLVGRLPRRPVWTHGWAQVRIGAQALAGRSAVLSSEWDCA